MALGTACLLVDFRRQWHSECMNALSTFVNSGSERVKHISVKISKRKKSTVVASYAVRMLTLQVPFHEDVELL